MHSVLPPLALKITAADLCQHAIEVLGSSDYAQADFETVLKVVLYTLGHDVGWAVGEAWLPDPHGQQLHCGSMWYADRPHLQQPVQAFHQASLDVLFKSGMGLPGRILESRQSEWIENLATIPEVAFPRKRLAKYCGLRTALGIPLLAGQTVLAVLIFFDCSPRPCDREHAATLERAAALLGPMLQQYQQAARYRQIFQRSMEGIFEMAPNGHFLDVNLALAEMLGYRTSEELLESLNGEDRHFYTNFTTEGELLHLLQNHGNVRGFCAEVYRRDGTRRWIEQALRPVCDQRGRLLHYEGSVLDVTERHHIASRLQYSAFHDELTSLKNRTWLFDALGEAIQQADRDDARGYGLLFIDLDQFHRINESFNHATGDRLLLAFSARIEHQLPDDATLARIGGDEFAILLNPLTSNLTALNLVSRLQDMLATPLVIDGRDIFLQISVGIVQVLPGEATHPAPSIQEVWRNTAAALARAKHSDRCSWSLFDGTPDTDAREQLELESALHWAIVRRELYWDYQPVVDLDRNQIVGFEALVRWQHPQWGHISPNRFIPVAEERGVIVEIGESALRAACQQLEHWQRLFPTLPPLWVSVNLSPLQLHPENLSRIEHILDGSKLAQGTLKLEITETALSTRADLVRDGLLRLRSRGIKICLDDFGTGYCGLSYLQQFPIDTIKIDRSFTQHLPEEERNSAIVRATLVLAHNLGLTVITEGIETEAQADYLRRFKCHYGQGFLFARPLNVERIEALLAHGSCLMTQANVPSLPVHLLRLLEDPAFRGPKSG